LTRLGEVRSEGFSRRQLNKVPDWVQSVKVYVCVPLRGPRRFRGQEGFFREERNREVLSIGTRVRNLQSCPLYPTLPFFSSLVLPSYHPVAPNVLGARECFHSYRNYTITTISTYDNYILCNTYTVAQIFNEIARYSARICKHFEENQIHLVLFLRDFFFFTSPLTGIVFVLFPTIFKGVLFTSLP
jgi:hypothetical protein